MKCKEFNTLADSYLTGNLPEEKQEIFEAHYFECEECFSLLKSAERLQSKEIPFLIEQKEKRSIFVWKPLLAFSSVVLVVLATYFIILHLNNIKEIYTISSFSAPGYIRSETRKSEESNEKFAEAMKYYNLRDYSRALDLLKRIPDVSHNPQVVFFTGICFLLTDKKTEAVKQFDVIISEMDPSYYDEALYYKAVALVRLNKKEQALDILKNLANMFSPYSENAKRMIYRIQGPGN
jgi:tetratricopeptide (TPR) repeat protein